VILVQSHAILGSNSVRFFYFSAFKLFKQQLSAKCRFLFNLSTLCSFHKLFPLFGLVRARTSQKSFLQVHRCLYICSNITPSHLSCPTSFSICNLPPEYQYVPPLGCRTGGVYLRGLRVGYRQVRVQVDILLPMANPYPTCGFPGIW
jgi:hypothetical protein